MNRIISSVVTLSISLMLIGQYQPLCAQSKNDSTGDSAFVNWAKAHAFQLETTNLQFIDDIVGPASVVALGEPAHGFHQPLAFRNQMFRYLIEKLGFTAIALETNVTKTRIAANFVAGGAGTVEQAAQALTMGDPTAEDMELLSWMREYNQQLSHRRKVKLYGMDIEMIGLPGDTVPSHPAIDEALDYLGQVDRETATHFSKILKPFLARLSVANYVKLSREEHDQLSGILDELILAFQQHHSQYIAATTRVAYEWACQNAAAARQTDRMVRLLPIETPGKISPDAWHALSARDSAMAENVLWILSHGEKVLVYAHNAHVKNAPTTGSVWDALQQPPNSTGQYLRKALGRKLVIFGISFAQPFDIKQPRSLEVALAKTGMSNFLLDLQTANTDPETTKWLAELRPMQANVVTYFNLRLSTAFDAIAYLGQASPAVRIK